MQLSWNSARFSHMYEKTLISAGIANSQVSPCYKSSCGILTASLSHDVWLSLPSFDMLKYSQAYSVWCTGVQLALDAMLCQ